VEAQIQKNGVIIELKIVTTLNAAENEDLDMAVRHFGEFLEMPARAAVILKISFAYFGYIHWIQFRFLVESPYKNEYNSDNCDCCGDY